MHRLRHRGLSQLAAEATFRAEAPRVLATLTRVLSSLDLAEDARRDTRVDDDGELTTLADQDRSRWHHDDIAASSAEVASRSSPARSPD